MTTAARRLPADVVLFLLSASSTAFAAGGLLVAVPWYALQLTNDTSSVVFALTSSLLPSLLLAPFVGVLVDTVSRKRLSIVTDLARAAVLGVLGAAAFAGVITAPMLYLGAFLLADTDSDFVGRTGMSFQLAFSIVLLGLYQVLGLSMEAVSMRWLYLGCGAFALVACLGSAAAWRRERRDAALKGTDSKVAVA